MTPDELIERRTYVVVARTVDEAGNDRRLGQRARLTAFVSDDTLAPGATVDCPAFEVRFGDAHRDLYWPEELDLVAEDVEAHH